MYILRRFLNYRICILFLFIVVSPGQQSYHFVANSNSAEATAYNNSHKVALHFGEGPNDTINVVFQSSDSIYIVYTTNSGQAWSSPTLVGQGKFPAIDINLFGFRHVAWQSFDNEIYYDCLDDWAPPVNVSQSAGMSALPDLVADSDGVIHVVWVEQIGGYDHIFYRAVIGGGVVSDTLRISGVGSAEATYGHPSISMFHPNGRIYVVWECYDIQCYSPYQIHFRYKEDNSWSPTTVWAHYLAMRHPSTDFSHGQATDTLSLCYEDSTTGNMEATFYGGNGGGYQTQGYSSYPVVATVGPTWSYLFWQEDSAGHEDILYDLYYFFSGWNHGSLRALFDIQESVRYPSVSGAYVVWTQGDSAPYSVYLGDFGYPIGIKETGDEPITTIIVSPNPFSRSTRFTLPIIKTTPGAPLHIYDSSGRLVNVLPVRSVPPDPGALGENQRYVLFWDGTDMRGEELPSGIYWCCLTERNQNSAVKVIKID
jgi:hypothetical protein